MANGKYLEKGGNVTTDNVFLILGIGERAEKKKNIALFAR